MSPPASRLARRRSRLAALRDSVTAAFGPVTPARAPAEAALRLGREHRESHVPRALAQYRRVALGVWTPLDLQATAFIEAATLCRDRLTQAQPAQRLFLPDEPEILNHLELARLLLFSALDVAPTDSLRTLAEHEDGRTRAMLFVRDADQPPVSAHPRLGYHHQAAAAGFGPLRAGMYAELCELEQREDAPSRRLWPPELQHAQRLRRMALQGGFGGAEAAWGYAAASNRLSSQVAALDGYLLVIANPSAAAERRHHARIRLGMVVDAMHLEGVMPRHVLETVRQRHL